MIKSETNEPKKSARTGAAAPKRKKASDAPAAPRPRKSATKTTDGEMTIPEPTQQEIARRAYELFEARGYAHGYAEEDWVRAERELRAARTSAAATMKRPRTRPGGDA